MTNKSIRMIRRIYGMILSFSIFVAALCLIGACLGIYDSGSGVFSREAVAAAFSSIALPVYVCLLLMLLSFPISWFLPAEADKQKPSKSSAVLLQRLQGKAELSACSRELQEAIAAQQKCRRLHRGIALGLLALTGILFLGYVLTGDRFLLPDITSSMVQAMLVLLPCLVLTFGYSIFAHYQGEKSMAAEISLWKQAAKEAPASAEPMAQLQTSMNLNILRAAILLLAVTVLLFGYFTGGTADVLTKAINICTECVGLG